MHAKLWMLGVISNKYFIFLTSEAADIKDLSMLGRNKTSERACKLVQGINHDIHARNSSNKS